MNILLMNGALIPADSIVDVTWHASPSIDPFDKSIYESDVEDILNKFVIVFHLNGSGKYENKIILHVRTDDIHNISRAMLSIYMMWSEKSTFVAHLENRLQEANIKVIEYGYH